MRVGLYESFKAVLALIKRGLLFINNRPDSNLGLSMLEYLNKGIVIAYFIFFL